MAGYSEGGGELWVVGSDEETLTLCVLLPGISHLEPQSCCNNGDYLLGISLLSPTKTTCKSTTLVPLLPECWPAAKTPAGPSSWRPRTVTHPSEPVVRAWSLYEHSTEAHSGSSRSLLHLDLVQEVLPAVM